MDGAEMRVRAERRVQSARTGPSCNALAVHALRPERPEPSKSIKNPPTIRGLFTVLGTHTSVSGLMGRLSCRW